MSSRMSYDSIKAELLKSKRLFEDPCFPPNERSLYKDGKAPQEPEKNPKPIIWTRARDMVSNPQFIVDGVSRHDIAQGNLGDCWFIAGVAVLADSHPELFERVAPLDQGFEPDKYTGMFRFNFWCYGTWVEVIVDDYLPTRDGKTPIYCRNKETPNEFWPSLLEKAFAKLRGSYEGLKQGRVGTALVDMTGGFCEAIDMRNKGNIPPDLYSLLVKSRKMLTMMGARHDRPNCAPETVDPDIGLVSNHCYSVTDFKEIPTETGMVKLVRLRNPWSRKEWKGAWSDSSSEMNSLSEQMRKELKLEVKDDGEFWMSFEDFVTHFNEIQLCHLDPHSYPQDHTEGDTRKGWHVSVFHDAWRKGVSAGGCGKQPHKHLLWRNPQFYVNLASPDAVSAQGNTCTMLIALMEKKTVNSPKISTGFKVYKLKNGGPRLLDKCQGHSDAVLVSESGYHGHREVTKRLEIDPGCYVIIPSTINPGKDSGFMLRLFADKEVSCGVLDEVVTVPQTHQLNDNVLEVFQRHAGSDNMLDATEISPFLLDLSAKELHEPLQLPLETCRSIVTMMDVDKSGQLDLSEVMRAWNLIKSYIEVFKQFDTNKSGTVNTLELKTMLSQLGFAVNRGVLTSIVTRYGGRDNQITLPDFIMVLCKLTSLFAFFHEQLRKKKNKKKKDVARFTVNEFLEMTMLN